MGNVTPFPGAFHGNIPANDVLCGALERDLKTVIVVGEDADGNDYCAFSTSDIATLLFELERVKTMLIMQSMGYE